MKSAEKNYIPSTTRIEAFSDGVIAIIITIMVFEIKVPIGPIGDSSREIINALMPITPKLLIYGLSFLVVAIFWVNHHTFFHSLARTDRALLWHNNHLLFWLSLVPFPTAFIGDHPYASISSMLYGGVLFMAAVAFDLMVYHASKADLHHESYRKRFARRVRIKSYFGPALYLLAILMALVSVKISLALYVIIPLLYFLPEKLEAD